MEIKNQILQGDCIEKLKELPDNSVDSIVTDPPYELGFMGKKWDNSGIAYNIELWKECLRVIKPGGYLLSFGGSRTYHRMACAIEDAGFEIRDCIMWVYGSGFPKSHNIGKAVDKRKDWEKLSILSQMIKTARQRLNLTKRQAFDKCRMKAKTFGGNSWFEDGRFPMKEDYELLKIGLELDNSCDIAFKEAEREFVKNDKNWGEKGNVPFSGYGKFSVTKGNSKYEGYGTALKPAHEPIVMARKPLSEKSVALNVLKYGTGGINIDGCRIGTDIIKTCGGNSGDKVFGKYEKIEHEPHQGRFPANFIHDGSDEVVSLFPDTKSGKAGLRNSDGFNENIYGKGMGIKKGQFNGEFGDSGSASRFFYCAKASKSERNFGLDILTTVKLIKQEELRLLWQEENMELAQLLLKDILGLGAMNLNIGESGNHIMVSCQKECLSIIKMEINKITELKTWNSLTHYLTKDYIQDVNLRMENGSNHVMFVESLKKLMIKTGISQEKVGLVMEDVKNVTYKLLLILKEKENDWQDFKNIHSTVKPIKLMQYLVRLVTPKSGVVLDPFAGSGTTLIACVLEDKNYIGIEKEQEYIKIANARLEYWKMPKHRRKAHKIKVKRKQKVKEPKQKTLEVFNEK